MNVLIKFHHGLGDAVQLALVLKHLRHYHPDWQIDVASLAGKHSAFHGLCRRSMLLGRPGRLPGRYDRVYDLDWPECPTCYAGWPSSKAERCLVDVFQLQPIPHMCRYQIRRGQEAIRLARRYLEGTCKVTAAEAGRYPAVLVHYEGNTSAESKNLGVETARRLCDEIIDCGEVPVILDWDSRSPLPDGQRIHNPHADLELWGGTGTGDAEVLAALVELSTLLVGVDSGPLHVAGATSTPTIGVWTGHHPLHYFSLADNVVHLVPRDHARLLRGDREVGETYFRQHYRYRPYDDLQETLIAAVREHLKDVSGGLVFTRNFWIRPAMAKQDLVVVDDVAEKDAYRVEELPMPRPVVVDVGAHIGCFTRKLHERNPLARIIALECCPENVPALKKNVGSFATVVQAAVTYQKEVALMSTVYPGCLSTGGSRITDRRKLEQKVSAGELRETAAPRPETEYWADFRPIRVITLEEILQEHGLDRIDLLKLDCEGSEMSILRNTTLLDKIGIILGEYHDKKAFMALVEERFSAWDLRILKGGEPGLFWLRPKCRTEPACANDPERVRIAVDKNCVASEEAVQQVAAPVVVSGPARSGTTFTQELLSSHSRIWIHGQSGMWTTMWRWYQKLCQEGRSAANRNSSIGYVAHFGGSDECRCRAIIGRLWRDFMTGYAENRPRWGWRAPWMSANPTQVEQLESFWPDARWVVCLREPFRAWQSQQGTYSKNLGLRESIRRWIRTVTSIQNADPARVFVMQVDLWSQATAAERQRLIDKLFDCLNEPKEPAVREFVQKWPRVHHLAGHAELSPQQRRSVLEWFPNLPELMESMGYACEDSN